MKRKNVILFILSGLVILGMIAVPLTKQSNALQAKAAGTYIHYQVSVHSFRATDKICELFVVMSDQNGNIVAPVQNYNPSMITYHFYEMGPLKGTRIASLTDNPGFGSFCPVTPPPDSKTGAFEGGKTYFYSLNPSLRISPDAE